jgi:hypothetical protein
MSAHACSNSKVAPQPELNAIPIQTPNQYDTLQRERQSDVVWMLIVSPQLKHVMAVPDYVSVSRLLLIARLVGCKVSKGHTVVAHVHSNLKRCTLSAYVHDV